MKLRAKVKTALLVGSLLGVAAIGQAAPTLSVGSASGNAGTSVNIPITFDPTSANVSAINFDLTLPAGMSLGTVTPGSIVTNAGKLFPYNPINSTTWRFIIYGGQTTMPSGTLLTVQINIAGNASPGTVALPLSNVNYSDPNGNGIAPGASSNGSITVTGGTPPPPPPPTCTPDAQFVGQSPPPTTMIAGQTYPVAIIMRNTGTNCIWTSADGFALGSQNPRDNLTWGFNRVLLGVSDMIGTNATKTFNFTVTAPATPGPYNLQWQMLQENNTWFGDMTTNVSISVQSPNQPPSVNAGQDQTITLPVSANLLGVASDDNLPNPPGTLTTTWSKVSGPGTVSFVNANSLSTQASFSQAGTYVLRLTASDSVLSSNDTLTVTVNPVLPPVNQPPTVNPGQAQTITLPSVANLIGSASDDNLPNPPGMLTFTWSKVSGPGTVSFVNANSLSTQASFSQAGTYVLRLTASDSALSATGNVTITVNTGAPQNQAPVVNAGTDLTITLPVSANLLGAASDDNLPNPPGTLTTTWSKVSGPGTVSFVNANSLSTQASFSQAGAYVLRLTASDSALSSNDTLTITVNPVSSPTNQPPVVNAGVDQTLTFPTSANLVAIDLDDGLPNPPGTVTVTWSKVSGPGTVSFGNANSLSTQASFSQVGTYVLRLTASDGSLSSSDIVTITVTPAPPPTGLLSASPTVIAPGQYTTLSWISVNATSVSIDHGIGTVATSGSTIVYPTATTVYTLTATGPGGTVTRTATVTIQGTGGPTGTLPTPTLNLPAYVSVSGSLSAGYPAGYGNVGFQWTLTPKNGSSTNNNPYGSLGMGSKAPSANFQTTSNVAGLASYALVPGVYTVTVQAFDGTGNSSAVVAQDVTLVPSDFSGVRVFPNPWRSDRHAGQDVTFDHLPLGSTVKIYTVSGHWVKTLTTSSLPDTMAWNLTTDNGDKAASGIYLYVITLGGNSNGYGGSNQKTTGKLVIIK